MTGASAQAEGSMGLLAPQLLAAGQQDGPWTASEANGAYTLENLTEPSALKYYFVAPKTEIDATVSVDVLLPAGSDPKAFAGLLFGFKPESRTYYLFVLAGDGSLAVYARDAGGLRMMMSSTSSDAKPAGWNRLRIVEAGDEISFSVNGSDMGSVGSDGMGSGGFGIAVAGLIRAGLANFTVSDGSGPLQ
jgi:hypothetical protein